MNGAEEVVRKRYEALGYTVVHCGPPDFLIFKINENTGTMKDVEFIEVKPDDGKMWLSLEQCMWRCALETVGCSYRVESPKGRQERDWMSRNYVKIDGHLIAKEKVLEAIRDINKKYVDETWGKDCGKGWDVVKMVNDYNSKTICKELPYLREDALEG